MKTPLHVTVNPQLLWISIITVKRLLKNWARFNEDFKVTKKIAENYSCKLKH